MSVVLETQKHNKYSQCLPHCEPAVGSFVEKTLVTVKMWKARSRQRRQLGLLDDRLLKDIGLTRDDVKQEIAKPFWR